MELIENIFVDAYPTQQSTLDLRCLAPLFERELIWPLAVSVIFIFYSTSLPQVLDGFGQHFQACPILQN